MKNNNISAGYVILTLLLFVSFAVIGFQILKIKRLEASRLSLIPGDTIPQLELLNVSNSNTTSDTIPNGVTLLMIFKTPCSVCNENINSWNSMANFFGDRINVIGIIPDGDSGALNLMEEKKVHFPLYIPTEKSNLRRKLHLKLNIAQTMIVYNNKVMLIKFGDLLPQDVPVMVAAIKRYIANSRKIQ